jgi:hypothetical protein
MLKHDFAGIGVFLRCAGLLALVLATAGGLLGMHVIGAGHPMAMSTTPISVAGQAAVTTHAHSAPLIKATASTPVGGAGAAHMPAIPVFCGCSTGCGTFMAMDGFCTPTIAPAAPTVSAPKVETKFFTLGEAFARSAGTKARDHIPAGPSLDQLSISRT